MKLNYSALTVVFAVVNFGTPAPPQVPHRPKPAIPRTWEDAVMPTLEILSPHAVGSPKPVYGPDREPFGYMEWLKKQDPIILWDGEKGPYRLPQNALIAP